MATFPFTVCDTTTKRILRTGLCKAADLPLQAAAGEVVLPVMATDRKGQRLNATGNALEDAPPPPLAVMRQRAQDLLDIRHDDELTGAVDFGGLPLPCAALTRARVTRAALASLPLRLRARNGVWIQLTAQSALTFAGQIDQRDAAIAARHAALSDSIAAATTRAELAALIPSIRAFWP